MGLSGKFNRIKKTGGQSTLEFAIIIPIVIIIILAASQVGLTMYKKMMLQQASREAARIISTTGNTGMAAETVKKICGGDTAISIEPSDPSKRKLGDMVTVRASREPDGFIKIVEWITGKVIVVEAKASIRMECD